MTSQDKVEIIADLKDLVSAKFDRINSQIDKMDSKLAAINKKNIGGGFLKNIAIGGGVLVGLSKAKDFIGEVVESLKKSEYFSASLKTLLGGNGAEAKALESTLVQLAKTTPFSLEDVQASTKQLLAYGFEAGKITDNLKTLGNVASGVGQPISEIVYLYGTLRTQGRAFSKDIYQFTGRGIPIVRELAKQFKVTDDKVMKLVEDGKVGFKEVEKAFQSMTSQGGQFFNMMEAQSKTVGGKLSNLGDTWEQLKVNIGKSQTGIIANTVTWAGKMVDIMNNHFVRSNFREETQGKVNRGIRLKEDKLIDRQYIAANADGTKYFERKIDRDDFLNSKEGANYDEGRGFVEAETVFKLFSNKFLGLYEKAAGETKNPAAAIDNLYKDVIKERAETLKLTQQHRISAEMSAARFSTLNTILEKAGGLKDLLKSKVNTDKKEAKPKDLEEAAKKNRPMQTIVNITNLVKELSNTVYSGSPNNKGLEWGSREVSQILIAAVNDISNLPPR